MRVDLRRLLSYNSSSQYSIPLNMFLRSLRQISSHSNLNNLNTICPFPLNDVARQLFDQFTLPKHQRDLTNLSQNSLTPALTELVLKELKQWKSAHEFFYWAESQPQYKHNCYAYNTMASILSTAKQKTQLKSLTSDVVTRGCVMTPGALGFFIRCVGNLGLVEEAQFVFENASKLSCVPNIYTYNCLLEVLAKTGRVDLMEPRFQEIDLRPDLKPDKYTYTSVLQCYCNARKLEKMLEIFDKMNSNGWVDTHVLTILTVAFCKWGKVEKACELVEKMEGFGMIPNEKTFRVLIQGFVKQGRVDKALEMFDKMKRVRLVGDFTLYSVLIDGLCENKELDRVFKYFEEMKMNGISPDTKLVRKIVSTFCENGDFSNAGKVFVENTIDLKPSSIVLICNAILDGLVNHGEINKAYQLLKLMIGSSKLDEFNLGFDEEVLDIIKDVKPNDDSFNIVVCGLCKIKKLDEALNLLNNMIQYGYEGKIRMYNDLISELCKEGRLEESYNLFHKIRDLGFTPTEFTYNSLLYGHCRGENSREALDLIKEMRVYGHVPWIKHCTKMVQDLCSNERIEEASYFLSEMIKIGFLPDLIPFSAIIDGLCKSGFVDKAEELFCEISKSNYLPDVVAHNILINGFVKSGNLEKAVGIFDEMLEKGLNPSVVSYNLMIDGLCKNNNLERAFCLLNKMVSEEKSPNVVTYTNLIDGLLNESRANEALDLWNEMREKGILPNEIAYTALVNGLCKCGKVNTALDYYREMREKGFEIDLFGRFLLINCLILEGQSVEAFELLNEFFLKRSPFSANCKTKELMDRAMCKLYKDDSTCLGIKALIDKGLIPFISSVDEIGKS
ncbi:hypothetical protein LUZ60_016653 [Juncus effusus]|nr:hypothetical protein LUZ60_016653 [Juncus effusus]